MWAVAVRCVRENVGDRIRDAGLTAAGRQAEEPPVCGCEGMT